MGVASGTVVGLLVVGKYYGIKAILATTAVWVGLLGVGCNLLCFALDHHFHYFGGPDAPILFLTNGFVSATVGGVLAGLLLFTGKGRCVLGAVGV